MRHISMSEGCVVTPIPGVYLGKSWGSFCDINAFCLSSVIIKSPSRLVITIIDVTTLDVMPHLSHGSRELWCDMILELNIEYPIFLEMNQRSFNVKLRYFLWIYLYSLISIINTIELRNENDRVVREGGTSSHRQNIKIFTRKIVVPRVSLNVKQRLIWSSEYLYLPPTWLTSPLPVVTF